MSNNVLRDRRTMDAAIGTFQADKKAAFTPKLGKVRPIDIISLERRKTDENTVTDLVEALARDGRFLQDTAVRDEGASGYRLIFGANRLEAWKRHFGEQTPIPADIYPADTPDALITIHEIEENLRRKELTAAERPRQTILLAAAVKKLDEEGSLPPISDSGEAETGYLVPRLASTSGGRGNKGVAQRVAEKAGITKRAVRKRLKAASAAIGEKIDLDRDTPEELERKAAELEKADKRQRAEPKGVRPKRRKPAPCAVTEDATPPAEPHAGETGSKIEIARKTFDALDSKDQFRFIYDICRSVGLEPFKMAPPAVFGLNNEELELAVDLPTEVAPATCAVAEQVEHGDDAAVAHAEVDDEAVAVQAGQGDNGAELGAEDLDDAAHDIPEAADPVIGAKERCAHCDKPFLSSDLPRKKFGRFWHRKNCVDHAKPIAIAA